MGLKKENNKHTNSAEFQSENPLILSNLKARVSAGAKSRYTKKALNQADLLGKKPPDFLDKNIDDVKGNLELTKTIYADKGARIKLDEEFTEFVDNNPDINIFFDSYKSLFYELSKELHKIFITNSTNYLGVNAHPKEKIIEDLEKQLIYLQKQIDQIERHHPYFKNGFVLSHNSNRPDGGSSGGVNGLKYYMHSGKKRLIKDELTYENIKKRLKIKIPDSHFIHFISQNGLDAISSGPPINETGDLFVPTEEINTYIYNG